MTFISQRGKHSYDPRTLICSCGKTKIKHLEMDLKNEKWKMRNFENKINVKEMIKDLCNS
jgi:hypothetical protein